MVKSSSQGENVRRAEEEEEEEEEQEEQQTGARTL